MDLLCINQIKSLSIDMIYNAKSGHPGVPLGSANIIYILFKKYMKFDYNNWINRSRFILSNGHACALLYSILFLFDYKINLNDLKNFRNIYINSELNNKTTGHPERSLSNIVDVTTGPLGQGIANGVGMAISEKYLSNKLNKENYNIINHKIFVLCGDGCIMEGISYESISLAGHLNLNNLILLYDDNNITLDGELNNSFSENIVERFKSMNWNTYIVNDASNDNSISDIEKSFDYALNSSKPTIIFFKTIIGKNSLYENTNKIHGNGLTENDYINLKKKINFPVDKLFYLDKNVINNFKLLKIEKLKCSENWNKKINAYKDQYYDNYKFIQNLNNNKIDYNLNLYLNNYNNKNNNSISTRKISGNILDYLSNNFNNIIFGSADVASSTCIPDKNIIKYNNFNNNYISFGTREHAMSAIANGISTYNLLPIISTFLVFSTYCLPSIRLSAISNHKVIYVFTHDSIAIGEDGITHQPTENLLILRSIPNLIMFRPSDENEVIGSYNYALNHNGPSCLCLTRQDIINNSFTNKDLVKYGAYIVYETNQTFDFIIISTGSELNIVYNVIKKLENFNFSFRIISAVSLDLFDIQNNDYKDNLLCKYKKKIISIEAGSTLGWYKYANYCIGIDSFGQSGKKDDVLKYFELDFDGIYTKIFDYINIK